MKINKIQKIIVGIIAPIVILFIGYGIIYEIYDHWSEELEYTYWCWSIIFLIIGIFEFFWFRDSAPKGKAVLKSKTDETQKDMKKCPFCTEEIQTEAIKSKHCGEWLKNQIHKTKPQNHQNIIQISKSDFLSHANSDSIEEKNLNLLDKSDQKIVPPKIVSDKFHDKEKLSTKIGWGWVIVFIIHANIAKGIKYSHNAIPFLQLIGIIVVLIIYFYFRSLMINRNPSEVSMASFKSGIVAFLSSICIVFIISCFGVYKQTEYKNSEFQQIETILKDISIQKLQSELSKLDQIEVSDKSQIPKAIELIDFAQSEIDKINAGFNKLSIFVEEYKYNTTNNKEWAYLIEILNMNKEIGSLRHLKKTEEYLDIFKRMLLFIRDHYQDIVNSKEPVRGQYEEFYTNYENALRSLQASEIEKDNALRHYLEKNPDVMVYLKQSGVLNK